MDILDLLASVVGSADVTRDPMLCQHMVELGRLVRGNPNLMEHLRALVTLQELVSENPVKETSLEQSRVVRRVIAANRECIRMRGGAIAVWAVTPSWALAYMPNPIPEHRTDMERWENDLRVQKVAETFTMPGRNQGDQYTLQSTLQLLRLYFYDLADSRDQSGPLDYQLRLARVATACHLEGNVVGIGVCLPASLAISSPGSPTILANSWLVPGEW